MGDIIVNVSVANAMSILKCSSMCTGNDVRDTVYGWENLETELNINDLFQNSSRLYPSEPL